MSSASARTPRSQLATMADLLAIPEEERHHEVLDGEVVPKEVAGARHGLGQTSAGSWVARRFSRQPNGPSRPGGWWVLSDVEIELAPHQIVGPDLAGWRRSRMAEVPDVYPLTLRPDWVCEIVNGADARRRDGVQKRRIYADAGVPYYWLVDMQRQVLTVLRWTHAGYVEVQQAERHQRIRVEPFEAVELPVGVLFGEDDE